MSDIVIKVENLSKAYQLGQIGTGTLSKDIHRWWTTKIRGQEDPFLKIGKTNNHGVKGESDIVWSLKDINFEIKQGDAVGIIGHNGAGKSTLLKLLSRVTAPTTGYIKVKGRIASLLEVGTGFHPELTGRENIYLNGAILGMRKKEIDRKFDEIVDFSGVERYIDTPVKRYSSGMYVRLAFAVAAHLESEILIVDEVLAVGDVEFQKKCLGKMGDISKGDGRTVLFVSHNMDSILNLCPISFFLAKGKINNYGNTTQIIKTYLTHNIEYKKSQKLEPILLDNKIIIERISFNNIEHNTIVINQGDKLDFLMVVRNESVTKSSLKINIEIKTIDGISITCFGNYFQRKDIILDNGVNKINIDLGDCIFKQGEYILNYYFQINEGLFAKSVYLKDIVYLKIEEAVEKNINWNLFIDKPQHGSMPYLWKNIGKIN